MLRSLPMQRGLFLLALLVSLFTSPSAFALNLAVDKPDIAVGETTFVKVDGGGTVITISWSADGGVSIISSDRRGATVQGVSAGAATVSAKINGSRKSVSVNVTAKQAAPNRYAPADQSADAQRGRAALALQQELSSGDISMGTPQLAPPPQPLLRASASKGLSEKQRFEKLVTELAGFYEKTGNKALADQVRSYAKSGHILQADTSWVNAIMNMDDGDPYYWAPTGSIYIPTSRMLGAVKANGDIDWSAFSQIAGSISHEFFHLNNHGWIYTAKNSATTRELEAYTNTLQNYYDWARKAAAEVEATASTAPCDRAGNANEAAKLAGELARHYKGDLMPKDASHEAPIKAALEKTVKDTTQAETDLSTALKANSEYQGLLESKKDLEHAIFVGSNPAEHPRYQQQIRQYETALRLVIENTPKLATFQKLLLDRKAERTAAQKSYDEYMNYDVRPDIKNIKLKNAAGKTIDMNQALKDMERIGGRMNAIVQECEKEKAAKKPPANAKLEDDLLNCLCRFCGGASGGYYTRDAKSDCNGGCTCWGPLTGWCTKVPSPPEAVKSCAAGAYGVPTASPEQIRNVQELVQQQNIRKLEADITKQLGANNLSGAVGSALELAKLDPNYTSPILQEVARRLKEAAWDTLNRAEPESAVQQLEQATLIDPKNQDAATKLTQARDYAAKWPGVQEKAKEFDGYIAGQKIWSAQKAMLEMQDTLRTMAAGQSSKNPVWTKVMNDFNTGLQDYNRFIQEKTALHTQYFKEQDYAAILRNAESMRDRELSVGDEKECQSRIDFARHFLGSGDHARQAEAMIRQGQYDQALDAILKGRAILPAAVEGVAKQLADLCKREGHDAELRRDYQESGRLFEIARKAMPQDIEAHRGANNAPVLQRYLDQVLAWQREISGHIAAGDWDKSENRLEELVRLEAMLPGEQSTETRNLLARQQQGYSEYKIDVEARKKEIGVLFTKTCLDRARQRLMDLRARHLIYMDQDWTRAILEGVDQAQRDCSMGGVRLKNDCGRVCEQDGGNNTGSGGHSVPADENLTTTSHPPWNDNEPLVTGTYNGPGIRVRTGNYGHNCGARFGNVTEHLAAACDGRARCDYVIDYTVIGDPAVGCSKDYVAVWRCPDDATWYAYGASPEAGLRKTVVLQCPGPGSAKPDQGSDGTAAGEDGWSTTETISGMYRIERTTGQVRISRQGNNPGGLQNAGLRLDQGLPVSGDFEAQVKFSNARIQGGLNQIELHAAFADGSIFYVVRDREGSGSHVWAPNIQGNQPCGNSGTLRMVRRGGNVTGYCDGKAIWSAPRNAPLTQLRFVLQNNGTNDPISVTFQDYRFKAQAGDSTTGSSDVAGKWRSSEGDLTLQQNGRQVSGNYTNDGGEVTGTLNGNVLEGWWIENGSDQRCAQPRNGRHYWGRIRWTFDGDKFTGTWSYCDKPANSGGTWTGQRIGTTPGATTGTGPVTLSAAAKLVLEDDKGPYNWLEGTEVQSKVIHAGRAAFRSTGNNHFTHRLGIVGDYAGHYRYLDFWLYLTKPDADIQLQVQVDGTWGKRWGYDGDAAYNGYGWAMEGTTAGLPSGRWVHQRIDLVRQLNIAAGQAVTGLAFSSDGGDVYYDAVYLIPSDPPLPPPRVNTSGKLVLEEDVGPYSWNEATQVQKEVVANGRASFRSTGNNHFAGADLGLVGDYPNQFRKLRFWVFPIGAEADIQLQVQVDGTWGKRWGFDAGPAYNGYGWAMEGTTANLKPGVWQELTVDLMSQLHINPGQRITGLAFSSDGGDVYYDSVYLLPNDAPTQKPRVDTSGRMVLDEDAGSYQWAEKTQVQKEVVANGRSAFRSTGNNHFTGADLGLVGDYPEQFRTLSFWLYPMGAEADIQIQVQVDGVWGKRWGYDAGPAYNGYGWAMEGSSTGLKSGRWQEINLDLLEQLHINPGQKITGLAFSSDGGDVYYDAVYLRPNANPVRKPAYQPTGRRVLEDDPGSYSWVERSQLQDNLVFHGAKAFRSTGNNHFTADLGTAGSGPGQNRYLSLWAFFMGNEADMQIQVQVNGSWGKRWGYDAGPAYNGYGWAMEGSTPRMPNGRWTQIRLDLLGQLHLKPGDRITGLAFSSDGGDVAYDSVYLLPDGAPMPSYAPYPDDQGGRSYTSDPGGRDYSSR